MLKHSTNRIDVALDLLNTADLNDLRDYKFVRDAIRIVGLYGSGYSIYGNEQENGSFDKSGVWQEPTQSAKLLVSLCDKNIKTFLEVGSWNGCWALFVSAYLTKFGMQRAVSIDIKQTVIDNIYVLGEKYNLEFINGSSEIFANEKFDFVFIDGGNTYEVVNSHWNNVGKAAKVCAFHDINCRFAPQIRQFWNDNLKNHGIEILDHAFGHTYDMMGIGVICS